MTVWARERKGRGRGEVRGNGIKERGKGKGREKEKEEEEKVWYSSRGRRGRGRGRFGQCGKKRDRKMNALDIGGSSEKASEEKPAAKSPAAPIVVSSDSAPAKLWKMISLFLVIISTALLVAFVLALVIDPCKDKEEETKPDETKDDSNDYSKDFTFAAPGGGLCSIEKDDLENNYDMFMCTNGTLFYDTAGMSGCACAQGFVGKSCEVMVPMGNVIVNARSKVI